MNTAAFQRARSPEAKYLRQQSILDAARRLGIERGVRQVTLADIGAAIGMHKSAMLRYFETREEIYLMLAAEEWALWSARVVDHLPQLDDPSAEGVARVLVETLVARPLFCDLLAQAPMNLERHVSMAAVKSFKLKAMAASRQAAEAIEGALRLEPRDALDAVVTSTSMAGALWQMAAPGTELAKLYQTDPELAHSMVDVPLRLQNILVALLDGFVRSADARAEAQVK